MRVAESASLVTPLRKALSLQRSLGPSKQRNITGNGATTYSFHFRPTSYLLPPNPRFLGNRLVLHLNFRFGHFHSAPPPIWIEHHPNVKRLPIGRQVGERLADLRGHFLPHCMKCVLTRALIDDLQVAAKTIVAGQEQPAPHTEINPANFIENTGQSEVAVAIWTYFSGLDLFDRELWQIFETLWFAPFWHGRRIIALVSEFDNAGRWLLSSSSPRAGAAT